jgi:hypothetical protein
MAKADFTRPLLFLTIVLPAVVSRQAGAADSAVAHGNESGGGGQFATPANQKEEPWFKSLRDSVKTLQIFDSNRTGDTAQLRRSLQAAEAIVIMTQLISAFEKHGVSPAKVAKIKAALPKMRFESVSETLAVERAGKKIDVDARTTTLEDEYQTELQFLKNEAQASLIRRQELYLHETCLAAQLEKSLEYGTSRALLAELRVKKYGRVVTNDDAIRPAIIERIRQGDEFLDLLPPAQRVEELRIRRELATPSASPAWDEPVGAYGESPFSDESIRMLAHLQFEARALPKELVKKSMGELSADIKEEFEALKVSDLTTQRYLQFRTKIAQILREQASTEIVVVVTLRGSEKSILAAAKSFAMDRAIEAWSNSITPESRETESWLNQYSAKAPTALKERLGQMKEISPSNYASLIADIDAQTMSIFESVSVELELMLQHAVADSLTVP